MRKIMKLAVIQVLLAGLCCAYAFADGGQVRVMQECGDYRLTVFTSPTPLRAGPIDVSVLVQDAATGQSTPNAVVFVELASADHSPPIRMEATTAAATNKLLRAALVELPSDGQWDVRVEVNGSSGRPPVAVSFQVDAAPQHPRWLTVWPWIAWPALAVALFAVHRNLVHRRMRPTTPLPVGTF